MYKLRVTKKNDFDELHISKDEDGAVEKLSSLILDAIEEVDKEFEDIVIFNIGTNKCIGDSLGPFVGYFLKDSNLIVYGDLESPNHANNLEVKYKEIKSKHPNSLVIAVDASVSDKDYLLNAISVGNEGIRPGAGMGKEIMEVGDISIAGNMLVYSNKCLVYEMLKVLDLSIVVSMAELISKSLNIAINAYKIRG